MARTSDAHLPPSCARPSNRLSKLLTGARVDDLGRHARLVPGPVTPDVLHVLNLAPRRISRGWREGKSGVGGGGEQEGDYG